MRDIDINPPFYRSAKVPLKELNFYLRDSVPWIDN
jgi:hypothetical protein